MAHKKAGGSIRNGRDSEARRLDVKRFGGESVLAGSIIVHQRGTRFYADANADCGRDHTLFAKTDGKVKFEVKGSKNRKFTSIETEQAFRAPVTGENPIARYGAFYTQ